MFGTDGATGREAIGLLGFGSSTDTVRFTIFSVYSFALSQRSASCSYCASSSVFSLVPSRSSVYCAGGREVDQIS